jgi:uncharacterized protein with HEPN domain
MPKDDSIYVEHILECIERILKYTDGISKDKFSKDEMIQDAVIRNIEIIGEASKKISQNFRKSNSHVPWKEIAGMRDKLIHDYLGVDIEVIWRTIKTDIPTLNTQLKEIQ